MSSSTPNAPRFLLDENVRVELADLLKSKKVDFKLLPKGASDRALSAISKRERRALVTNDSDFSEYTSDRVFSVIWLRIPQQDVETLLAQFEKLLTECQIFSKRLINVNPDGWKAEPLFRRMPFGKVKSAKYG